MIEVGYVAAFFAGLFTFLAPCTLPLVPAYLGFVGGTGGKSRTKATDGIAHERMKLLGNALLFTLGFTGVFMAFGLLSGSFGRLFIEHREVMGRIGGVLIALFGLSMFEFFPSSRFLRSVARPLPPWILPGTRGGAFMLGFLFALGWSPCLGPILGSILVLASTDGYVGAGAVLLGVYSLGLALPFLLIAAVYGSAFTYVRPLARYVPIIADVGAAFIVAVGVLLAIGEIGILGDWANRFVQFLGYEQLLEKM